MLPLYNGRWKIGVWSRSIQGRRCSRTWAVSISALLNYESYKMSLRHSFIFTIAFTLVICATFCSLRFIYYSTGENRRREEALEKESESNIMIRILIMTMTMKCSVLRLSGVSYQLMSQGSARELARFYQSSMFKRGVYCIKQGSQFTDFVRIQTAEIYSSFHFYLFFPFLGSLVVIQSPMYFSVPLSLLLKVTYCEENCFSGIESLRFQFLGLNFLLFWQMV